MKKLILVLALLCSLVVAGSGCGKGDQTGPGSSTSMTDEQKKNYTVYVTNTGNKYHMSGCQYLRQSSIQTNLYDAESEGYTACSVCNPPK